MNEAYGQIISFYSFKGGVGRSMALANVAALLCRAGKSVLVVDWDLEAPGLNKFFEQSSPGLREQVGEKPGILDLIWGRERARNLAWREATIKVKLGGGTLDLISAGRRDDRYASRLQTLRWDRLYDELDIGQAFEDMRDDWKRSYDYVLLDSRTGVTDIGDVCTALFPDLLVTVFVANEQNIEGTKLIIDRARTVHGQLPRDRSKLTVVPLLGRDESYTEYELSSAWRERISRELGFTLSDWMPKDVDASSYFQKVFIPYYSYWSFGENLPVVQREQEIGNPTSISAAYARLTGLLESGLDWKVLEKGVNSAEISSLRSRASVGEAKSAELDATRQEIEILQAKKSEAESRARTRVRSAWIAASLLGLVSLSAVLAVFAYYERHVREQAVSQVAESSTSRLTAALDQAKNQLEQQRNEMTKQIADLQKQNADLVNQLRSQNSATQSKLDEIIRQNNAVGAAVGRPLGPFGPKF
jgi:MinD-like ATPase involved in chromosome partitioning or flagellar assembly